MKNLDYFCVLPSHNLREVMQKIDINGFGIALVVDDEKKLLGLVTDGDIRRAILKGVWLDTKIDSIMNKNPYYLDNESDYRELLNQVIDQKISRLPILDENKTVVSLLIGEEIMGFLSKKLLKLTKETLGLKQKHILITGGAGYIGSILIRQLLERGYEVKVFDKFLFGKNSISDLNKNNNFSFIEGDVGHIEKLVEAIKGIDVVVHLAEIVGDPACAIDPQKTQQANYLSTISLVNACKYFQINRFIYASSCSVYGTSKNNTLSHETSEVNPVSLYAKMKTETEKVIINLADDIFSPTILRFATVFGVSPRMRFDLVINNLTVRAVKEGKITIFGGDQWRPFIHVSDVANAIISTIEAPLEKIKGEIFNVGSNDNNFTINQIGNLIKEIVPTAEIIIENKEVDKRNYCVDFSKIKNNLDFQTKITLPEGIKGIITEIDAGNYSDYQDNIYFNHKIFQ